MLPLAGNTAFELNIVSGAIMGAVAKVSPGWVNVACRNRSWPR
jgi:hypothetical protein